MSYGRHTRLSTSELFNYSYSRRIYDGIQQAEEGSSPDRQPWYDESSPYMSRKARAEAVQLDRGDSASLAPTTNTISTASFYTTTKGYHGRRSKSAFPQEVQEEESLWYEDMASDSLFMHGRRDSAPLSQRAPPRYQGTSTMSLDTGDFLGCPVGGSHSNHVRPSSTQGGASTTSGLDGQLPSMEGSTAGDPTTHKSRTTRLRRGLMSGLQLGVFVFRYTFRLTITLTVPRVMCLCVT